ncbi:uncharacterized protein [Asterias amurensis]|uniref:uncharacterized protein isoform X2 n=1 Tax=Asterias amurensis TaxID=7602 RepID=UPI003AB38A3C
MFSERQPVRRDVLITMKVSHIQMTLPIARFPMPANAYHQPNNFPPPSRYGLGLQRSMRQLHLKGFAETNTFCLQAFYMPTHQGIMDEQPSSWISFVR